MKKSFLLLLFSFLSLSVFTQEITQTIKGNITDISSQKPLAFATVIIIGTTPIIGATTDVDGHFIIKNIPVGRYSLKASFLGYESIIKPEIMVTSAKEVILNISLQENAYVLDEIILKPKIIKEKPNNIMASISARMLSVEEANRYAGGFDDPARLAASFPGVASGVGNNALIIRGNAPKYLQWKIEDVEIPNPNHFANLGVYGAGGLTALSSNLLANSDFYTGAFPAEYNNALSGVFDIKMRNGNNSKFEHSITLGAIGIDLASEGPIGTTNEASYLVNYRYSTLGLISTLLPEDAQGTNYQDLSFKLKLPTKKAGSFSLWGIGLIDNSGTTPEKETLNRNYFQDIEKQDIKQYMGALGLNNRLVFKNNAYLNSTLAYTANGIDLYTDRLDNDANLQPENQIKNTNYTLTFKSFLHKKFSSRHTNKTGITIRNLAYDLTLKEANNQAENSIETIVSEKGFSTLVSAYSSSSLSLKKWKINFGISAQLFNLNNSFTLEPRLGLNYKINQLNELSFGYGLHSRIEPLPIYFANTINTTSPQANKKLEFSKAHHFILAYDWTITEKTHFKIEPYFQYLFNIPVIANSTNSLINLQNDWFINDAYDNLGKGLNYGLDLTLEHYLNKDFYYLISASIFNSKYKTNTGSWYNTRFNKNYILNTLIGKEFKVGRTRHNRLGLNIKLSIQGGDRYSKIDTEKSIIDQDVVYNVTTPFTEQAKTAFIVHFTTNYEWYTKRKSHNLSFKILNATNFKEYQGHRYNINTSQVEDYREALIIPNVSYKISF
ncbi:TonB-dependent receptor [Olleya sp. Bg11-27]|uniref:TonB-dependent receptor n=1 Tax=Olleya sp. Bg11-27 TaxID=2058135 RepID=UPI000C312A1D|nr:carboxypeptidase-like regulatory domain-containing protein [Olleya sp. Bg11-27]AUC77133.1 prevent-host-death protein [Olleya sp. Bg11-27]